MTNPCPLKEWCSSVLAPCEHAPSWAPCSHAVLLSGWIAARPSSEAGSLAGFLGRFAGNISQSVLISQRS